MRLAILPLAAAILIAVPAVAQTAIATPPVPAPVKEKKICRREEVTGSILGGRAICHTKEEWARIDEANSRASDAMLSRARSNVGGQAR